MQHAPRVVADILVSFGIVEEAGNEKLGSFVCLRHSRHCCRWRAEQSSEDREEEGGGEYRNE